MALRVHEQFVYSFVYFCQLICLPEGEHESGHAAQQLLLREVAAGLVDRHVLRVQDGSLDLLNILVFYIYHKDFLCDLANRYI